MSLCVLSGTWISELYLPQGPKRLSNEAGKGFSDYQVQGQRSLWLFLLVTGRKEGMIRVTNA